MTNLMGSRAHRLACALAFLALLAAGPAPGKPSWYFNSGRRVGGMFTNQLLGAIEFTLDDAARNPELARWSTIVNRATVPIVHDSRVGEEPQGQRQGLSVDPLPLMAAGNSAGASGFSDGGAPAAVHLTAAGQAGAADALSAAHPPSTRGCHRPRGSS